MKSTYRILDPSEAVEIGAPEELVHDLRSTSDWEGDALGVFRCEAGAPVELIGSDGGEPEDQTLSRDWGWIAGALEAAYALGLSEGLNAPAEAVVRAVERGPGS